MKIVKYARSIMPYLGYSMPTLDPIYKENSATTSVPKSESSTKHLRLANLRFFLHLSGLKTVTLFPNQYQFYTIFLTNLLNIYAVIFTAVILITFLGNYPLSYWSFYHASVQLIFHFMCALALLVGSLLIIYSLFMLHVGVRGLAARAVLQY